MAKNLEEWSYYKILNTEMTFKQKRKSQNTGGSSTHHKIVEYDSNCKFLKLLHLLSQIVQSLFALQRFLSHLVL